MWLHAFVCYCGRTCLRVHSGPPRCPRWQVFLCPLKEQVLCRLLKLVAWLLWGCPNRKRPVYWGPVVGRTRGRRRGETGLCLQRTLWASSWGDKNKNKLEIWKHSHQVTFGTLKRLWCLILLPWFTIGSSVTRESTQWDRKLEKASDITHPISFLYRCDSCLPQDISLLSLPNTLEHWRPPPFTVDAVERPHGQSLLLTPCRSSAVCGRWE